MAEICAVLRDATGAVQASVAVSVWTSPAATTLASLYTNRTHTQVQPNPVTSGVDGVIHCYTNDPQLWYTTPTQTTPLPLPVAREDSTVLNVRDFGAAGDGVTDDTDAFVAAVAQQRAISEATWGSVEWGENQWPPPIYIPSGVYLVRGGELLLDYRGATIYGDGRHNTSIWVPASDTADVPFITLGLETVDLSPPYWWLGAAGAGGDYELRGFTIAHRYGDDWTRLMSAGPRVGTGIFDNAVGNGKLIDISVRGFKYGFCAIYGHDFGYHYNCDYMWCDTGMYFGPGSEQVYLFGINVGVCRENLVFEGCANILVDGLNTSTPQGGATGCDIRFLSQDAGNNSRFNAVSPYTYIQNQQITINNLWEERVWDCTWKGDTYRDAFRADGVVPCYISVEGTLAQYGIVLNNPHVQALRYAGESAAGAWMSFNDYQTGATVEVDQLFQFDQDNGLFAAIFECDNSAVSYLNCVLRNPWITGQGWPPSDTLEIMNTNIGGGDGNWPVSFTVQTDQISMVPGETYQSHWWTARRNIMGPGTQGVGFGASGYSNFEIWSYNGAQHKHLLSLNADYGAINFGDNDISGDRRKLRYHDGAPADGMSYQVGDICFYKNPTAGGKIGVVCVTAGTAGGTAVFKPFGAIDP